MIVRKYLPLVLILGLLLSACAASAAPPPEAMMENDDVMMEDVMMEEEMEDAMEGGHDEVLDSEEARMKGEMMMAPEWFSAPLVDVHTGESFSIQELEGRVVLVETMAVWCSNCLRQQREVQALHAALGEREDFTSIALDIDPNEDADTLRNFATQNEFDWLYVVAPVEVAREFGELYGQQFLNPPSTPILLIDRHAEVHTLPFGIKSAAELQSSIEALLGTDM
jgi:thiol-disulfide isomerase/thioredoxin